MADESRQRPHLLQTIEQERLWEQSTIEEFLNTANQQELDIFASRLAQPGNIQSMLDIFARAQKERHNNTAYLVQRAAYILQNLQQETARNYIYVQVIRFRQPQAIEIGKETNYAPADPRWRVVYYIFTERWDKYQATDPDGTLLAETLQRLKGIILQDLVGVIRQAGRTDLLQTVPNIRKGQKFELEQLNWPVIQALEREKRFDELWEMALQSSAYWSSAILRVLKNAGWQPPEKHYLPLFEKLVQLVQNLPEELPYRLLKNSPFKFYMLGTLDNPVKAIPEGHYLEVAPGGQFLARIILEVPGISSSISLHSLPEGKTAAFFDPYFDATVPNLSPALHSLANRVILTTLAFSQDAKVLAAGGNWADKLNHRESLAFWVFDIEQKQRLAACQIDADSPPLRIAVAPDKTLFALMGQNWLQLYRGKTNLTLVKQIKADEGELFSDIAFCPTEQLLALGLAGGQIRLLETPELGLVRRFETGITKVSQLRFSPDGQTLAFGEQLGWLYVKDGAAVCRFEDNPTTVSALTFSPNGELLASGYVNGTIRAWSAAGSYNIEYTDSTKKPVALAYSPDGQQFITIDQDGILTTQTSRLAYLYNMPVAQGTLQDLQWVNEAANLATDSEEKAFYEFIAAQLDLKWRYEYEIETELIPDIDATAFDIEIEE